MDCRYPNIPINWTACHQGTGCRYPHIPINWTAYHQGTDCRYPHIPINWTACHQGTGCRYPNIPINWTACHQGTGCRYPNIPINWTACYQGTGCRYPHIPINWTACYQAADIQTLRLGSLSRTVVIQTPTQTGSLSPDCWCPNWPLTSKHKDDVGSLAMPADDQTHRQGSLSVDCCVTRARQGGLSPEIQKCCPNTQTRQPLKEPLTSYCTVTLPINRLLVSEHTDQVTEQRTVEIYTHLLGSLSMDLGVQKTRSPSIDCW